MKKVNPLSVFALFLFAVCGCSTMSGVLLKTDDSISAIPSIEPEKEVEIYVAYTHIKKDTILFPKKSPTQAQFQSYMDGYFTPKFDLVIASQAKSINTLSNTIVSMRKRYIANNEKNLQLKDSVEKYWQERFLDATSKQTKVNASQIEILNKGFSEIAVRVVNYTYMICGFIIFVVILFAVWLHVFKRNVNSRLKALENRTNYV